MDMGTPSPAKLSAMVVEAIRSLVKSEVGNCFSITTNRIRRVVGNYVNDDMARSDISRVLKIVLSDVCERAANARLAYYCCGDEARREVEQRLEFLRFVAREFEVPVFEYRTWAVSHGHNTIATLVVPSGMEEYLSELLKPRIGKKYYVFELVYKWWLDGMPRIKPRNPSHARVSIPINWTISGKALEAYNHALLYDLYLCASRFDCFVRRLEESENGVAPLV